MHHALHKKRPSVRGYVSVPALWKRDKRGRFLRRLRKAYTRRIFDRTRMVTGMEMIAENISQNNVLLKRLMDRGVLK